MLNVRALAARIRSTVGLMGLLLLLGVALGAHAEPPSVILPGRKFDSNEPWGAFLGRAAHFVIGMQYAKQHPDHIVFLNTADLFTIVKDGELGNPKRLSEFVRRLRPDITDVHIFVLFEIKPDNEVALRQGREQARLYLTALNSVAVRGKKLVGGTGFDGSLFVEFEEGGVLWQLSWHTPEPGVTLYRWRYRPKQPKTSWQQRAAQPEEELPLDEVEQRGELVEQVLRAAYKQGEWPSGFKGQVLMPLDCQ